MITLKQNENQYDPPPNAGKENLIWPPGKAEQLHFVRFREVQVLSLQ